MVARPSFLLNCTGRPAPSFTGEYITQPLALTTKVSQTSVKGLSGSRLVTTTGRVTATRELRRTELTALALCIVSLLRSARAAGHAHRIGLSPLKVTQACQEGLFP